MKLLWDGFLMLLIPDFLFKQEPNRDIFSSDEIVIHRYESQCPGSPYEVMLRENLLLFVSSGTKTIDVFENTIVLKEGQGAIIPKGTYLMQEVESESNSFQSLMILMTDNFISKVISSYTINIGRVDKVYPGDHAATPFLKFEQCPFTQSSIQSINIFFNFANMIKSFYINKKVIELFTYILDSHCGHLLPFLQKHIRIEKSAELLKFMEMYITEQCPIYELARRYGCSLSTFNRGFEKSFGESAKQWIQRKRLRLAAEQLRNSSSSVTEIAISMGFADGSHFSKIFKNEFGCSPLSYRLYKSHPSTRQEAET